MKWCFLVNNASFVSEFLGNIAHAAHKNGDSCSILFNSKIAEYEKKRFFPKEAAFFSKVDWCIANYDPAKKEFGSFSWRDFLPIVDRFKYYRFNYTRSVEAVGQLYQFFEWIMEHHRPDAFFGEPPAGLFGEMAYYFAKKYRIPFLGVTDSRIGGKIEIFDSEYTDSRFQRAFEKMQESDLSSAEKEFCSLWIKKFISHKTLPSYAKAEKFSSSQFVLAAHFLRRIREAGGIFLAYALNRSRFKAYDYESEAIFLRGMFALFEAEKIHFRSVFQKCLFSPLDTRDQFFLYPLHVQPESSSLVFARYYSNQLYTVRNIAFALPFPYKLYVKEHPWSVGTKPFSFYRELARIPNVRLISPEENVQQLIGKSAGVVTLSSTIGMEAALSGKSTYVLGEVSYEYHPWCTKVKNFDELAERISFDMKHPKDILVLENINLRFIASNLRNTVQGSILEAGSPSDPNNYQMLYSYFRNYALSAKT